MTTRTELRAERKAYLLDLLEAGGDICIGKPQWVNMRGSTLASIGNELVSEHKAVWEMGYLRTRPVTAWGKT